MSNNYYKFWTKKILNDGFRFIKIVIGIGLSFCFAKYLNLVTGILFFGWVLIESLLETE